MSDAKTTFGRRLRLIRKARGMTLEELGRATSIGFKHIADIERGEKTPSFEAIDRLANGLNVPPYELFLPLGASSPKLDQSLRRSLQNLVDGSSPVAKRLLLIIVALLQQIEHSLPDKAKAELARRLEDQALLAPSPVEDNRSGGDDD